VVVISRDYLRLRSYPFPGEGEGLDLALPGPPRATLDASLSADANLACVMRDPAGQVLELVDPSGGLVAQHQTKRGRLLGWRWAFVDTLVLVCEGGLEVLAWTGGKLRALKDLKMPTAWFVYAPASRALVCSSDRQLQAFYLRPRELVRLPRVELESGARMPTREEAALVVLYGRTFLVQVLGSELRFFQITRTEVLAKRTRIDFVLGGPVALQVLDNLLVLHSLSHRITMLFDVKDHEGVSPIPPLPVGVARQEGEGEGEEVAGTELYGEDWRYAVPSVIWSARLGRAWSLQLRLESIVACFQMKDLLAAFLLRRAHGHAFLLRLLRQLLEDRQPLPLLAAIFDLINGVLKTAPPLPASTLLPPPVPALPAPPPAASASVPSSAAPSSPRLLSPLAASPGSSPSVSRAGASRPGTGTGAGTLGAGQGRTTAEGLVVIGQEEMYQHVFAPLEEAASGDGGGLEPAYLVEYIRSLHYHQIPVEYFVYAQLIEFLVRRRRFYQLHQFLQYHVLQDSVHIACLLLSLEAQYPPAAQLALDMLKRLQAPEQILEVLLLRGHLVPALRYLRSLPAREARLAAPLAPRFLEAAAQRLQAPGGPALFLAVCTFFDQRRELQGLQCEPYLRLYQQLTQPTATTTPG
jgi:hypothetical protein